MGTGVRFHVASGKVEEKYACIAQVKHSLDFVPHITEPTASTMLRFVTVG